MGPSSDNKLQKRRSSDGSESSKKKASQACAACRRKKVKCDGQRSCERCVKSELDCVYDDKPIKKKDMQKTNIRNEHIESKIKYVDLFLRQLSNLIDISDPGPLSDSIPSQIIRQATVPDMTNTIGRGLYIPDKYLRTDRVPDPIQSGLTDWNLIAQELLTHSVIASPEPVRENLVSIYFQYVNPVIPILHKGSFMSQVRDHYPISALLLNAIYCVSSRWDLGVFPKNNEPRGWVYYQEAIRLLHKQAEPKLSTVQALFLLLKYNDHVRRKGFIWRTRLYFQMIVRMCKDLGLPRDIPCTENINLSIEIEKRKRTFWAIYCYDVMMSTENGTECSFSNVQCTVGSLCGLPSETSEEHENVKHFALLARIMYSQSLVIDFLRRKYVKHQANNVILQWNEEEMFTKSVISLEESITAVTSVTSFPQKENMCYTQCILYLALSFTRILLHRPFAKFQSNDTLTLTIMSNRNHCTKAALDIKAITELLLDCDTVEDMHCSIRGIRQIVHYLSSALTVFKEAGMEGHYTETLELTHQLGPISSLTESTKSRNSRESKEAVSRQQPAEQQILKRKSFHLPSSSGHNAYFKKESMENLLSEQQQHQQNQVPSSMNNLRNSSSSIQYPATMSFNSNNSPANEMLYNMYRYNHTTMPLVDNQLNTDVFNPTEEVEYHRQHNIAHSNYNTFQYRPENTNDGGDSSLLYGNYLGQQQHQHQQFANIPNHESLMGLLYNEEENRTRNSM